MANTNFDKVFEGLKDAFDSVRDMFSDMADEHEDGAATAQQEMYDAYKRYRNHVKALYMLHKQVSDFVSVVDGMNSEMYDSYRELEDDVNSFSDVYGVPPVGTDLDKDEEWEDEAEGDEEEEEEE